MDDPINPVGEAADDWCRESQGAGDGIARQKFTRIRRFAGSDDCHARTVEQTDIAAVKKPPGPIGRREVRECVGKLGVAMEAKLDVGVDEVRGGLHPALPNKAP
jgi:hypothetical protein